MRKFITSDPNPEHHKQIQRYLTALHIKGVKEFKSNKEKHVKNQIKKRRLANKRKNNG